MEQLSFASVYRTAAILAAFSHASAAGEAFDACPAPRRRNEAFAGAEAPLGFRLPLFERCRSFTRWPRKPVPAPTLAAGLERGSQMAAGCAEAWTTMGPHRPSVASHFTFADQIEGHA